MIKIGSTKLDLFSHQPVSALSKTAVGALLGLAVLCGFMSYFASILLLVAAAMWLSAVLIALGIRWAPLLGSLVSSVVLYIFLFKTSFPVYHLTHPKDPSDNSLIPFVTFVITLLILSCSIVTIGTGAAALIQNYLQRERKRPRWLTSALTGMAGIVIGAILIGAIAQPSAATAATTAANGEPIVHMSISRFSVSSVTVPKGSKLLLVDDGTFHHNLSNGSWVNGQPQPEREASAPTVNNLDVNGKSVEIGPFTTAGTYHIYCSLHEGMMLTITVQ